MKKGYLALFSVLFMSMVAFGQSFDNFDSYTAGTQLACQSNNAWHTWSNSPCTAEDPMVVNTRSFSSPNSMVIMQNDDLVKLLEKNSGKWYTSFRMFVPTGKAGYFNILSDFTFTTGGYWAFECYFDPNGIGRLQTGAGTTNFTWTPGQWNWVEVIVDLAANQAQFWMGGSQSGGTLVLQWPWTNGSSTGTGPLVIDAIDFFGATALDEMYVDDFYFGTSTNTPVELTSYTATSLGNEVTLNWSTATEMNNRGFEIERSSENGDFITVAFVEGKGTTTELQQYSYVDKNLTPGVYAYRLKQLDFDGRYETFDAIEVNVTAPLAFELGQNYPNPFNPSTKIVYNIDKPGMVKLAVYNLLGEEMAVLANDLKEAGQHEVSFDASNLPSGSYIYKLESNGNVTAKKMLLTK